MQDLPYIIYLAIFGIACLSYVFVSYRGRLNAGLQSALIWVLLFMGLIALYGYKEHISSQLFPNRGTQISEDVIRLPRSPDGHYYADLKVNGVYISFVVDTGASDIVLSISDANKIGINTDSLRFYGIAETANGTVQTAHITLDTLEIAGLVDYGVRASVSNGDSYDSLLGMSYLSRFSKIEISGNNLFLHR